MFSRPFHPSIHLIAIALASTLGHTLPAQTEEPDFAGLENGIAAIAEGEVVTIQQIREELEPVIPRIRVEATSEEDFNRRVDELGKEILQNIVDRIIIVKAAEEQGIQIPQSYIDTEYNEVINRDFGGDRARFLEYLRDQNTTPREFREDLRKRIIVSVMRQRNRRSQSEVSPERIEAFYLENKVRFYQHEAVHLRQIILSPLADESPGLLEQTARKILRELEEGRAFGDLAREYSQDDMSRSGGDWGWVRRSDLREELSDIAFELGAGEHSEPVEIDGNIFILYIEDKREEKIQPVSEVREVIEERLIGEIARESQEEWLAKLREDAYVRYFL